MGSWAIWAVPLLDRIPAEHAAAVNTALAWTEYHRGDFVTALAGAARRSSTHPAV